MKAFQPYACKAAPERHRYGDMFNSIALGSIYVLTIKSVAERIKSTET